MNEVQRRQKALAVVRDMDTDAIIQMIECAPSSKVPFPARKELQDFVSRVDVRTGPDSVDLIAMLGMPQRDPNRKPVNRDSEPIFLGASQVAKTKSNPMRVVGEPDRTVISVPGEGPMEKGDRDVSDTQKENVDYLGKLFTSDGSEQENHSDDEGWL